MSHGPPGMPLQCLCAWTLRTWSGGFDDVHFLVGKVSTCEYQRVSDFFGKLGEQTYRQRLNLFICPGGRSSQLDLVIIHDLV